jgi:hypothetical protein
LYEIETLYARLLGAGASRSGASASAADDRGRGRGLDRPRGQAAVDLDVTSADAGLRFLERSMPNLERAKEAFKLIVADGHRAWKVVDGIRASFRTDVRTTTSARRQRAHS